MTAEVVVVMAPPQASYLSTVSYDSDIDLTRLDDLQTDWQKEFAALIELGARYNKLQRSLNANEIEADQAARSGADLMEIATAVTLKKALLLEILKRIETGNAQDLASLFNPGDSVSGDRAAAFLRKLNEEKLKLSWSMHDLAADQMMAIHSLGANPEGTIVELALPILIKSETEEAQGLLKVDWVLADAGIKQISLMRHASN